MTTAKKLLIVAIVLFASPIFGQNIVTDRPDQTESSETVGDKNFQIESGMLFQNSDNNSVKSFFGPSTLLRYGISKNIELRFVSQYEKTEFGLEGENREFDGFNDLEIGAKIQLFKREDVNTEIAFLSHLIIPTAKTDLTSGSFGVINKLAISHSISDKVDLGYNIGYDLVEKQSVLTYSLALGISISNKVGFYVEPYGNWAEQNQFESNFDTGLTYLVNPNFQMDISYGTGINHRMEYISAGFSWKIYKLFQKNNQKEFKSIE